MQIFWIQGLRFLVTLLLNHSFFKQNLFETKTKKLKMNHFFSSMGGSELLPSVIWGLLWSLVYYPSLRLLQCIKAHPKFSFCFLLKAFGFRKEKAMSCICKRAEMKCSLDRITNLGRIFQESTCRVKAKLICLLHHKYILGSIPCCLWSISL